MSQPNTVLAAIRRIKAYAEAQGWSRSRLATEADMSDTVLRDFDNADWNPTVATLRRLEGVIPAKWQPGDPVPAAKRTAA